MQVAHRNWVLAKIIKKADTPRSYIVKTIDGKTFRRNSIHIQKTKEVWPSKDIFTEWWPINIGETASIRDEVQNESTSNLPEADLNFEGREVEEESENNEETEESSEYDSSLEEQQTQTASNEEPIKISSFGRIIKNIKKLDL